MKPIRDSEILAGTGVRKMPWRMSQLLTASLLILAAGGVQADDGAPDPTFSGDGKAIFEWPTAYGGDSVYDVSTRSVTMLADGSTVTAGSVQINGALDKVGIAKFRPDGFEDDTFGDGGAVLQDFTDDLSNDSALGVFAAPGNKILVVGYAEHMATFSERPAMLRLHSDGTLDTSFGTGGKVVIQTQPLGTNAEFDFRAAAMTPDGKILIVGSCTDCGGSSSDDFLAVRLNANGTVDTSFSNAGWFHFGRFDNQEHYLPEVANAIAVDTQGRVVLAGYSETYNDPQQTPLVVRLTSAGQLDTSFNGAGYVNINVSGSLAAAAIAIDSDSYIIVASNMDSFLFPGALAKLSRLNPQGVADATFGSGGFVTLQYDEGTNITALAIRHDGRIVAAGWINPVGDDTRDFFAARTLSDGALDNSFDGNGVNRYTFPFASNSVDVPFAMILSGERPVIAGSLVDSTAGPDGTFATGVLRLKSNLIFANGFE